jgi:hypothetical protein
LSIYSLFFFRFLRTRTRFIREFLREPLPHCLIYRPVVVVAAGVYDICLALGVEKLKDTGYGGLPATAAFGQMQA